MKLLHGLIRVCLLSLITYMTAMCSPFPASTPHSQCGRVLKFWIDPEFSPEETVLITESIFAWQEGSNKTVCFVAGTGGIRLRKATEPNKVHEIEQRGSRSNNVSPQRVVGLASYPDAWILSDKLFSDRDFYATSIHEVGHLLGLSHYEPRNAFSWSDASTEKSDENLGTSSWMYPSIDKAPQNGTKSITDRDKDALFRHEGTRE